jgi:aldose 1-epimerase
MINQVKRTLRITTDVFDDEIGDMIDADSDQLRFAAGYDHCWVTGAQTGALRHIASVEDLKSGLRMDTLTDLPGVQFYTANFLPRQRGKGGAVYGPRCALCLETEYYPDSLRFPDFPQPVFAPGEAYRAETVYRFSQITKS